MSQISRITAAGNKISSYVKKASSSAGAKVDKLVTSSKTALEKESSSNGYNDAADATAATFEAIVGSIDKFESGDPKQIASGVLDIIGEVSQFASLLGPKGQIIAAIVGPICSIINLFLGAGGDPPESEEDMIKRVVTEALDVYRSEELQSEAAGVQKELAEKMTTVSQFFARADELGDRDREYITDEGYTSAGSEFIGTLLSYIRRDLNTDDDKKSERVGVYIATYTSLCYMRTKYLFMLSALYGTDPHARVTADTTRYRAIEQRDEGEKALEFLCSKPDDKNHKSFAQAYLQPIEVLAQVEAICEQPLAGRVMTIYNRKQQQYLYIGRSDYDRSEACTKKISSTPMEIKFAVFGLSKYGSGSYVEIFSLASAGYVYAADYNPFDRDRRRVNSWTPGNRIRQGPWEVINVGNGEVWLKNKCQNEYMYAADYKGNSNQKYVFTWRPGNPINQGYWIFKDV